jgi:hypothetical protein
MEVKNMSYTESKKSIDKIRQGYGCKGDIIFKTAVQYIVEHGQYNFRKESWFASCIENVDNKHDLAERDGKILWISRDFEKALLECARDLAQIDAYDLMMYIQREVYLGGGEPGEPDYQRALQIIRNCLCYTADCYGAYSLDCKETLDKFREMSLTDEEIAHFGWEFLFDVEDEENY